MNAAPLPTFPLVSHGRTLIIAEAGVNHNGNMAMACQLIEGARQAGADAVKFQLFDPAMLTTGQAPLAMYQANHTARTGTQQEMLEELALTFEEMAELHAYARQQGIAFLCSPFDENAARWLVTDLHLPFLKIASGELTNQPFLEMLATLETPLMLSTGMATLAEVTTAVETLVRHGNPAISLLHCVSAYPAPAEAINLRAIQTLQATFPHCLAGYSDHTLDIHIAIAAVALGARIIEKHLTLDSALPGPDHRASLPVEAFTRMVQAIREVELALGSGQKVPHPIETDCRRVARKSLVVGHALPAGHVLSRSDLVCKRPGDGISPVEQDRVLGCTLTQSVTMDQILTWDLLTASTCVNS
jgi:sialic acid synthase SpsE